MKKKTEKKLKEVREREAKLKLGQNSLDRQKTCSVEKKNTDISDDNHNIHLNPTPNLPDPNIKLSNLSSTPAILTQVPPHQHLHPVENLLCHHNPQCLLRAPHPPPHGPTTLKQYELQLLLLENEAERQKMESLKSRILTLVKPEPGDTFDNAIEKLEYLKSIFESDDENSEFDQLIETVINYREALNDTTEHDPDYYDDLAEMEPHYWEGEDGSELIFYDD